VTYEKYQDGDYAVRCPLDGFEYMKDMEDKILSLNKENLKVLVVCSGMLYG